MSVASDPTRDHALSLIAGDQPKWVWVAEEDSEGRCVLIASSHSPKAVWRVTCYWGAAWEEVLAKVLARIDKNAKAAKP